MLKIKELREEHGLTQQQLAEAIGNMQRNVSNWEKGVSEPDIATLITIANLFGVTLDELCGREEIYEPRDAALIHTVRTLNDSQKTALSSFLESMKN